MASNLKINNPCAPVVLICPLDWGLGHATRMIPVIKEFQEQGCKVILGTGKQTHPLLKAEFPALQFVSFPDYNIRYSKRKSLFIPVLLLQIPKILKSIRSERKLLDEYIREFMITIVISDNRFGLYSAKAKCIYITHQLKILFPSRLLTKLCTRIHGMFIKQFHQCWVPDFCNSALAGDMSSLKRAPFPIHYLGPLSRFRKSELPLKFKVCISISGPEPQRTFFENKILEQVASFGGKVILIRGLPAQGQEVNHHLSNLQVHNHLPAMELNAVFEQSEVIISRSGYTTIMDLIQLQKPAVLVPTPGQYEQEYLAQTLQNKKYFLSQKQDEFSLQGAVDAFHNFSFEPLPAPSEQYKEVIANFLATSI